MVPTPDQIKEKIKSAKTGIAVNYLEKLIRDCSLTKSEKNVYLNQLILIGANFSEMTNSSIKGIANPGVKDIKLNDIHDRLLKLLENVEKCISNNNSISNDNTSLEKIDGLDNDQTTIELTIKGNLGDYTDSDRDTLLKTIENLLDIDGEVRIKKISAGSVKIEFDMPSNKVEELFRIIEQGKLAQHNVVSARIIFKNPNIKLKGLGLPLFKPYIHLIKSPIKENEYRIHIILNVPVNYKATIQLSKEYQFIIEVKRNNLNKPEKGFETELLSMEKTITLENQTNISFQVRMDHNSFISLPIEIREMFEMSNPLKDTIRAIEKIESLIQESKSINETNAALTKVLEFIDVAENNFDIAQTKTTEAAKSAIKHAIDRLSKIYAGKTSSYSTKQAQSSIFDELQENSLTRKGIQYIMSQMDI